MAEEDWQQRVPRRFHSPRDYLEAATDQHADDDLLYGLAGQPFDFVHRAVARHPAATARTLLRVLQHGLPGEGHEVVSLAVQHPAADEHVFAAACELLSQWLERGGRPYSAVLALANRGGLTPEQAAQLASLPGASARLRGALQRAMRQTDQARG